MMQTDIRQDSSGHPRESGIVIGIPTYRRPHLLAQLLRSLAPELRGRSVRIVVADNACGEEVPAVVAQIAPDLPAVHVVAVTERGIAAVRNALVEAAYRLAPDWRWLIMLDDDGEVQPGWFEALTRESMKTRAHATGGAVVCPLPSDAGLLARNSEFARRPRQPSGLVPMLVVGQNVCISRDVESLFPRPWFNMAYGVSGGEDHEFFMRIKRSGGQLGWADEAVVSEPQPADRLTARSVLYRSLTTGITTAAIERQMNGSISAWLSTARYVALALAALVVHTLSLRRDKIARALIGGAYALGRLPGMSRLVAKRYAQVKPS